MTFFRNIITFPFLLQILYGWAKDAPKLELPEGVGFKVGGESDIKYLVLQVHYASVDRFKGNKLGI